MTLIDILTEKEEEVVISEEERQEFEELLQQTMEKIVARQITIAKLLGLPS